MYGGAKRERRVRIALGEWKLQAALRAVEPGEADEPKAAAKKIAAKRS